MVLLRHSPWPWSGRSRRRRPADGRVTVEGADLTVLALGPEEIFSRMARLEDFNVAVSENQVTP